MEMVTKQEFLQAVAATIGKISDTQDEVEAAKIAIDGEMRDCIRIEYDEGRYVNVGVDNFYKAFCDGDIMALTDAAEAIINAKKTARKTMDYREAKSMLTCRLVNPERNQAMLDSVPNVPFRDLSVSFCLMIDDIGYMTTNVTNEMMARWGVSVDELYEDALNNMKKMPTEIRSVYSVMAEMAEMVGMAEMAEIAEIPADIVEKSMEAVGVPALYVVTNAAGHFGAAMMLDQDVLEYCAGKMGGDYYLLPSSVNEFLITPVSSVEPDALQEMISGINRDMVAPEAVLADHAYLYCAAERRLMIV